MGQYFISTSPLRKDLAPQLRSDDCLNLLASLSVESPGNLGRLLPDDLRRMHRQATRWRRVQREIFPKPVLNETCWDILLHCFSREIAGQQSCVKQIRIALDEPSTSLLRRLQELEGVDMIARTRDPLDGRRTIVALTQAGATAMIRYFKIMAEDLSD